MRGKAAFYSEIAEDGKWAPFLDLIKYLFFFNLAPPF